MSISSAKSDGDGDLRRAGFFGLGFNEQQPSDHNQDGSQLVDLLIYFCVPTSVFVLLIRAIHLNSHEFPHQIFFLITGTKLGKVISCYNSIYPAPIWAVAENYRFEPAFVEGRKLMAEIGDIINIHVTIEGSMNSSNPYYSTSWRNLLISKHEELKEKLFDERAALEAKYQKLYQALYTKISPDHILNR